MVSQMTNTSFSSADWGLVSFQEFLRTRKQPHMLEHVVLDQAARSEHPMSLPLETMDQVILNRLAEAFSPESVYLDAWWAKELKRLTTGFKLNLKLGAVIGQVLNHLLEEKHNEALSTSQFIFKEFANDKATDEKSF